jgi:hypothetical protein
VACLSRATRARTGAVCSAPADPLRVYPFELRFLSRRKPPDRWVIDLSAGDDLLRQPQTYHEIPNAEDSLFVAEEYVALSESKGWRTA